MRAAAAPCRFDRPFRPVRIKRCCYETASLTHASAAEQLTLRIKHLVNLQSCFPVLSSHAHKWPICPGFNHVSRRCSHRLALSHKDGITYQNVWDPDRQRDEWHGKETDGHDLPQRMPSADDFVGQGGHPEAAQPEEQHGARELVERAASKVARPFWDSQQVLHGDSGPRNISDERCRNEIQGDVQPPGQGHDESVRSYAKDVTGHGGTRQGSR
ncbi:hypothetical protein HIM_03219 [Hirsutella minnesotensis 3608]|nr:hypothetical protein HIM_03219 [Hirsutella minnesotensis 3608]